MREKNDFFFENLTMFFKVHEIYFFKNGSEKIKKT